MYGRDAEERLVEMPEGIDVQQKIDFLNKEYRKWRGRVTHADAKVRTEATMRLTAITKLRKKLAQTANA